MTELRHHRDAEERQAQHVECHQRTVQSEHVCECVGDRLDATCGVAAFPNDCVWATDGFSR